MAFRGLGAARKCFPPHSQALALTCWPPALMGDPAPGKQVFRELAEAKADLGEGQEWGSREERTQKASLVGEPCWEDGGLCCSAGVTVTRHVLCLCVDM